MDRLHRFLLITLLGIIVALSLIGVALLIKSFRLWTQEAAGWAQAIGSVVAIGVAIWIAHSDSRERRDERHAVAIVAAVKTNQQVVSTLLHLQGMAKTATFAIEIGSPQTALSDLLTQTEDWPKWTVEEIAMLAPLPNRCSLRLAHGLAIMEDARTLLRAAIDAADDLGPQGRKARLNLFRQFCEKARKPLYSAHVELEQAGESLGHT